MEQHLAATSTAAENRPLLHSSNRHLSPSAGPHTTSEQASNPGGGAFELIVAPVPARGPSWREEQRWKVLLVIVLIFIFILVMIEVIKAIIYIHNIKK